MIGINVRPNGTAGMDISGAGRSGFLLSSDRDGPTSLQIYDKNERVRIKLGLEPDGSPVFEFFDENGKSSLVNPTPKAEEKKVPGKTEGGAPKAATPDTLPKNGN